MSKIICLTQGKFTIVDDDDYEELSKHKWGFGCKGYAKRNINTGSKTITVLMHRLVNNTPDGLDTDHINGNKLDNRKCNLRSATITQNHHNTSKRRDNTSGFKGVVFFKQTQKWTARMRLNGKNKNLGYFNTPKEASEAYNAAAELHQKEFAHKENL